MAAQLARPTVDVLLVHSDEELAHFDPVAMNLIVARGIPSLAHLNIDSYVAMADEWARDLWHRLPALEVQFYESPADWQHDLAFFRLGLVAWYAESCWASSTARTGTSVFCIPIQVTCFSME